MGIVEQSLLLVLVAFIIGRYVVSTRELAIQQREKHLDAFQKVINNEKHSPLLRNLATFLFYKSIDSNALPKMIFFALFHGNAEGRKTLSTMSKSERKIYLDLIGKAFTRINLAAGFHWYFLFFMLIFLVGLVLLVIHRFNIGLASLKTSIESMFISQTRLKC
jgi:hypothetical protein